MFFYGKRNNFILEYFLFFLFKFTPSEFLLKKKRNDNNYFKSCFWKIVYKKDANYFSEFFLLTILFHYFLGLGFRPQPPEDNVESTLIWYKASGPDNYKHWVKSLEEFLQGKFSLFYVFLLILFFIDFIFVHYSSFNFIKH